MKKIFISLVLGLFLVSCVCSYYLFGGLIHKQNSNIDDAFEKGMNIAEEYGGAVIVSYDTETGDITGYRRQDYTVMPKTGALSVTSDEAERIGMKNLPKNVVVIPSDWTMEDLR